MKSRLLIALITTLLSAPHLLSAVQPTVDEVKQIAFDAYIFAYPMLRTYRRMYNRSINKETKRSSINEFSHRRSLSNSDTRSGYFNNDTLYSLAKLDLRREPFVLSIPVVAEGQYYSFFFSDLNNNHFAYIGPRTTGTNAGNYIIAGPNWKGNTPNNVDDVYLSDSEFVSLETSRGIIKVEKKNVVHLPLGLYGFEDYTDFALFDLKDCEPFRSMLSIQKGGPDFVVVESALIFEDYDPLDSIGPLDEFGLGNPVEIVFLSLVTLAENPEDITANLRGPILLNLATRKAIQVVLQDEKYSTKVPIMSRAEDNN